ncbi:MAG: hypothetical protein PF795_00890, partial [Kiritimatiellae bacterium]|nr:hypothetical protein [Kiritimatiellia bacterium]
VVAGATSKTLSGLSGPARCIRQSGAAAATTAGSARLSRETAILPCFGSPSAFASANRRKAKCCRVITIGACGTHYTSGPDGDRIISRRQRQRAVDHASAATTTSPCVGPA